MRRLRTLQSVADELWRLQKVREREFMEVSHLNSDTAASRRSYAAFTTGAHRPSTPEFKVQRQRVKLRLFFMVTLLA